ATSYRPASQFRARWRLYGRSTRRRSRLMAQLRSGLGGFVLLGGLLFVTPPAAAQMPDPDERAVEGHRLSVDLVKRATAANLAMKKAETAAPESETSVDDDRTGDSL